MTKAELRKYRKLVEAKEAELWTKVRGREEIAIQGAGGDLMETVQGVTDRELAIDHLVRDTLVLRQVQAALRRIADGTYGICVHCEQPIPAPRLRAIPWAVSCVQCQQLVEQRPMAA